VQTAIQQRQAGGVVTAVFEGIQTMKEKRCHVPGADSADNSAHEGVTPEK